MLQTVKAAEQPKMSLADIVHSQDFCVDWCFQPKDAQGRVLTDIDLKVGGSYNPLTHEVFIDFVGSEVWERRLNGESVQTCSALEPDGSDFERACWHAAKAEAEEPYSNLMESIVEAV